MSKNVDKDLCIKLVEAIQQNFNLILINAGIELNTEMEFDTISEILDNFIIKINVIRDKRKKLQYEKYKKRFTKFLNYNSYFITENFILNSELEQYNKNFFESFNDGPTDNWNLLHIVIVAYLSYLKQTNNDPTLNYKGMIEKLTEKIEKYSIISDSDSDSDSDSESEKKIDSDEYINVETDIDIDVNKDTESNNPLQLLDNIKKQLPQSQKTPSVIKNLLGDIKGMLNSNDTIDSKSIINISKDLSTKYQTMIESGDVNISDLLSGVIGLLNDPDTINNEFNDIDATKLPDPSMILADISNDPNLKQAMNMLDGINDSNNNLDMNLFSTMMSGMMKTESTNNENQESEPKTVNDLEKEIERMMTKITTID
jgi:hypothetical protein